jgi:hypothetical protein
MHIYNMSVSVSVSVSVWTLERDLCPALLLLVLCLPLLWHLNLPVSLATTAMMYMGQEWS